ncbi:MAG: hypothetical protein ACREJO_01095 [Phycisphaerales bacterium]
MPARTSNESAPGADKPIHEVLAPTTSAEPKTGESPLHMPGPKAIVAEEIAHVGPEGRPGDPGAGPKLLRLEVLGVLLLVLVFAIILGLTMGWPAGLFGLAFGCLALFLSPVLRIAMARAKDRQIVVDQHAQSDRAGHSPH